MLKPIELQGERNFKSLKTNLTVWVVYSSIQFKAHMDSTLAECLNLNLEWMELSQFNLDMLANKTAPDMVYIETGDKWAQRVAHVYASGSEMEAHHTTLVVFGDETDTSSLKMALRLGASDYFSREVLFDELYPLLKVTAEEKVVNRKMGELTLFINSKGGAGATTLATNTAIELVSYSKNNVLLVDLDLYFSDSADYLNSRPKYTINEVIESLGDIDELSLEGLIHQHSSGLNYLSFNPNDQLNNYQNADQVSKMLAVLRQYYSHIIVDMSRGIEKPFQKVISPATHVFLVVQQNITSVKHATNLVRTMEFDYGLNRDQIEIIVNRYEKKASISLKDVDETLGGKTVYLVPNNFSVAMESANMGSPIVQGKRSSAIKNALAAISHRLEHPSEVKKGWLRRLFS